MKYYIIGLLFFLQVLAFSENNPFSLQKNFTAIDKAEYTMFASLEYELKKAEVVPRIPIVNLKDLQIGLPEDQGLMNSLYKTNVSLFSKIIRNLNSINNSLKIKEKDEDYFLKKCEKEACEHFNLTLNKTIRTKESEMSWLKKNIVKIDLEEEKHLKKLHLQKLYEDAVLEVNKLK